MEPEPADRKKQNAVLPIKIKRAQGEDKKWNNEEFGNIFKDQQLLD